MSGTWAGGFEHGADHVFLQLHFEAKDHSYSGSYDAPLFFQRGRSLKRVTVRSSAVSFEIPHAPDAQLFTGELSDGALVGHVRNGSVERPCHFTRLAPIKPENYSGLYQVGRNHFVSLRTGVEMGLNAVQSIDFESGRIAVLFPTTAKDFFTGPALLVMDPVDARVKFTLDAEGRATEFAWSGAQTLHARRVTLLRQEMAFENGGVTLAGELVIPNTPGPHPVIVFAAGGSTYGTREMFRVFAEFFAIHGVAGLIYDKRGLGASTGDWLRAGFEDLAGDALAAVRTLKARPDIDARRIGMMGASQSGWIVALAASQSKDVAFIISQSGPGVGPEECELYRSEAWLRADGFPEEEIREAMKFIRQRYHCALTGEGWDALADAERAIKGKAWFAYSGGSAGQNHPFWHFWKLIRTFDPVPAMEKVNCPVLGVFGARDTFLPAEKSARIWRAALEKAGNKDVTIRLFPDGDHSLVECKTGGLKEAARARRFVPGYLDTLRDWTLKHVQ